MEMKVAPPETTLPTPEQTVLPSCEDYNGMDFDI
jgi:hypothetical protein